MERSAPPVLFCLVFTLLTTVPATLVTADDQALERGQAIAEARCARCHAIAWADESAHSEAPPFRDIAKRYAVEGLAESLAEGIYVGHADMPEFVFPPDEISDLLTYMDSLSAE